MSAPTYTGTFRFGDYDLFKGLLHNPLGLTEVRITRDRGPIQRKCKTKIIVTYAIHNDRTGEAYVGSTECFFTRWGKHLADLNGNRHTNENLQRAFDEAGAEAFTIRILRSCESTDDLLLIEEIDGYKHYKESKLYNVRLGSSFLHGINNRYSGTGRTKRSSGRIVSRTHFKARWYDGTAQSRT